MRIAILALQGAFAEHGEMLNQLGVEYETIRQKRDLLISFDGLILPGGESTVMCKLLRDLDLYDTLLDWIRLGMPVFGTCAGLLLLAEQVIGGKPCFGTFSGTACRNAYGRQLGSFVTEGVFAGEDKIPMTFIRAPYLETVGDGVSVLSIVDGKIVAAREKNQLVTAFHPELTSNLAVHQYFLRMISAQESKPFSGKKRFAAAGPSGAAPVLSSLR